jgi:hypothetical protein
MLSAKRPMLCREQALGKEAHALPRAGTRQRGPCFAESRLSAKVRLFAECRVRFSAKVP